MYIIMKKKHVILGLIIIALLITTILIKYPVKKAIKVSFPSTNQQEINENDTKIICKYSTATGPQWEVVGKNGKLFDITEDTELVILKGKAPKQLNTDLFYLYNPPANMFEFEGKLNGYGDYKGDGKYKIFEVKKWNIIYPVHRESILNNLLPTNALTPYDFLPFDD